MSRKNWTSEEKKELVELYSSTLNSELMERFNASLRSLYAQAAILGLKKTPNYLKMNGGQFTALSAKRKAATQFKPGHISWNKNTKGLTVRNKTSFQSGRKPHNHRPVGSERITKDGYLERKIKEPRTWQLVHRIVWIEARGSIPDGYAVKFIDGNKLNTAIENLTLIKRDDLMNANTIHRFPEEIKEVIRLTNKLKRKINGKK
jgi:hypothetical protein